MPHRFGLVVLTAVACGGSASTDAQPPITTESDAASVDSTEQTQSDPASVDSMQADPGYTVLPIEACGGATSQPFYLCRVCISVPAPRCLGGLPAPATVPAACANPECEAPLSILDRSAQALDGSACISGQGLAVRGQCADGKDFVALLGNMDGFVTYFRNGIVAGAAAYSNQIGKCECGGESFADDATCVDPTFEAVCDMTTLPSTPIKLPFADGHRSGPCLCVD